VAGLLQQRPRFDPMVVYVVGEESLVQFFPSSTLVSAGQYQPQVQCTHISGTCHRRCIISATDVSVLDVRL